MKRRPLLLAALGFLAAGPAAAQEALLQAEPPPRPHRRPRAVAQPRPEEPAPSPPPEPAPSRLDAAPVPNRNLEAPRVVEKDHPRLSPDLIYRRMPSRGMAAEGSPHAREEQLFQPAPGARLSLPFSY